MFAYVNRAIDFAALNQLTLAIEDLTKAIEISPDKAIIPWLYRGLYYYQLQMYEKTIPDLTKALEKDSLKAFVWSIRGDCYSYLKNKNIDHNISIFTYMFSFLHNLF